MACKSFSYTLLSHVAFLLITTSLFSQEIVLESVDILSNVSSGRNTMVLTDEDIQNLPINSTDELLRFIPGVEVQSRGGFGVQSDITLRGATFNQVLILIDGVRINDPLTGHFNGYIPLSLNEIQRVEISKGAAASIYGADAVGGVINFISKYSQIISHDSGSAEVKKGSNHFTGVDVAFIKSDSLGWFYGGSLVNNTADGESFANPNFTNYQLGPERYTTFFDLSTLGMAVGKRINKKWRAHLRVAGDARAFNAKYFYTASKFDESTENTKIVSSHLQAVRMGDRTNTTLDFAQRYAEDEFVFNPLFSANNHRTQFYLFQGRQFLVVSDKLQLNYGIQADWRAVFSNDRGNHQNFHAGSHVLANYQLSPELTCNFGFRGDWDDNYQFEVNPHINLLFQKSKFNVRGSINRAIRSPDFTERFISTEKDFLSPGRNLGNPDLFAEHSWNAELGSEVSLGKNQRVLVTYFSRFSSNLIDYALTPGSEISSNVQLDSLGNYNYALNVGRVVTNGVEIDWSVYHKFDDKFAISGKLGYTWLETKKNSKFWSLDNLDGLPPTKYLNSHAKHLVNGFLSFNFQKWTVSSNTLWKQRKSSFSDALGFPGRTDYLISNLSVNYKITGRMSVGCQVNNVGNVRIQDVFGAVLPGRWFIGVFNIRL